MPSFVLRLAPNARRTPDEVDEHDQPEETVRQGELGLTVPAEVHLGLAEDGDEGEHERPRPGREDSEQQCEHPGPAAAAAQTVHEHQDHDDVDREVD